MGSEGYKDKDKYKDAECKENTHETNTYNEPYNKKNKIPSLMDKQYGTISRENMRATKRKCDLPPKIRIHQTTNN